MATTTSSRSELRFTDKRNNSQVAHSGAGRDTATRPAFRVRWPVGRVAVSSRCLDNYFHLDRCGTSDLGDDDLCLRRYRPLCSPAYSMMGYQANAPLLAVMPAFALLDFVGVFVMSAGGAIGRLLRRLGGGAPSASRRVLRAKGDEGSEVQK